MSGMAFGLLILVRFYTTWSESRAIIRTRREWEYGIRFMAKVSI
jgi:hypothetical protein